jgi:hypothetical protein
MHANHLSQKKQTQGFLGELPINRRPGSTNIKTTGSNPGALTANYGPRPLREKEPQNTPAQGFGKAIHETGPGNRMPSNLTNNSTGSPARFESWSINGQLRSTSEPSPNIWSACQAKSRGPGLQCIQVPTSWRYPSRPKIRHRSRFNGKSSLVQILER